MKKKSMAMMLVLLIIAAGLAGCSTKKDDTPSDNTATVTPGAGGTGSADFLVGFANNSDTYNYCAKFRAFLKQETEALGMQIMVTDAGGDTNVQNGQIDDFIVQDANVVSAISNDLDGSVPALEAARAADLPYVSFLTTITGADDYDKFIYVGSKNYDAGTEQGKFLVDKLPENARILYFTGEPNDQQYIDRKQGLMDQLATRSDIEVLSEYNVKNQKDLGMSTTEDVLQAYDKFDAIVCQNDDSALGVVEALKSAGRLEGVVVIGIDGSDDALNSVKAGEMTMTVLQDAQAQAKAGADIFKQIKDGVDPAAIQDVYVPFQTVTADNVDDFLK
jgi:ABC-type sugar transport system substrate-binding protein